MSISFLFGHVLKVKATWQQTGESEMPPIQNGDAEIDTRQDFSQG